MRVLLSRSNCSMGRSAAGIGGRGDRASPRLVLQVDLGVAAEPSAASREAAGCPRTAGGARRRPSRHTAAAPGNGAGGAKAGSRVTGALRFHGQTSWQMSQPNSQPAITGVRVRVDVAAVLDRQVGDAAARVEHVRRRRRRRSGRRRGRRGRCRSGRASGSSWVELGGGQHHADEEPGAELAGGAASCSCRSSRGRRARRGRAPAPARCRRSRGSARRRPRRGCAASRSSRGPMTS